VLLSDELGILFNLSAIWDANTYDSERRRLVPCFDEFYGVAAELVGRFCPSSPRILDLGAGTGILSSFVAQRVQNPRLSLLDASGDMLERAKARLASLRPEILVQGLTANLPSGPFDAVISALAIHHLSDEGKRSLYARILRVLSPGGIFINAEQVLSQSPRLQRLFETAHFERSRTLGSSETEIENAITRMSHDRCTTLAVQLSWLEEAGFADVDCFFRWFLFAVFGGWKPNT
jgi:tRNA (cmo5U34)-methyltransferase